MPEENLGSPVPREEPFIVPASAEETFDSVWIKSINIFSPNTAEAEPTEGNINIEMLPYDAENKKVLVTADFEGATYINVPNRLNGKKTFWQAVDEVPEVKTAMDAILAAIPALRTWANTPPPEPDPPVDPEPTPEPDPDPVDDGEDDESEQDS